MPNNKNLIKLKIIFTIYLISSISIYQTLHLNKALEHSARKNLCL